MLNEPTMEREGLLVVLSSPSGGGKTSIYRAVLEKKPHFRYSVSVTTRPPRKGEIDGISYKFISIDEFERLRSEGALAEWALVHNHYYGSPREYIDATLSSNAILLFDLDVQGGISIRKAYPRNTVLIFILPPTFRELVRRLKSRNTEDKEAFDLRLKNALWEYDFWEKYDYLVINDELEKAVDDVIHIIEAERLRSIRVRRLNWKKE